MKFRPLVAETMNFENGRSVDNSNDNGTLVKEGSLALNGHGIFEDGKRTEMHSKENNHGLVDIAVSLSNGDTSDVSMNVNRHQLVSVAND